MSQEYVSALQHLKNFEEYEKSLGERDYDDTHRALWEKLDDALVAKVNAALAPNDKRVPGLIPNKILELRNLILSEVFASIRTLETGPPPPEEISSYPKDAILIYEDGVEIGHIGEVAIGVNFDMDEDYASIEVGYRYHSGRVTWETDLDDHGEVQRYEINLSEKKE